MKVENRERLFFLWLILSAFGIMFAVLSCAQESGLLPSSSDMGGMKGVFALITGFILYILVAHNMSGGPGDK